MAEAPAEELVIDATYTITVSGIPEIATKSKNVIISILFLF